LINARPSTGLSSIGFLDDAVDRRTAEGLDGHRFVAVVPDSRVCGCLLTGETGQCSRIDRTRDGTFDIATYMKNAILPCE
jgi:hypothetical protein